MGNNTSASDKYTKTTDSTSLTLDELETMDINLDNDEFMLMIKLKEKYGQSKLFESSNPIHIKSILEDIMCVEKTYVGGIESYINNAKNLLRESSENVNKFKNCKVEIPQTYNIKLDDPNYLQLEQMGMNQLRDCAFVLVAGGLGERLGYPSIKIGMPSETTTHTPYIGLYLTYLKAYQTHIKHTTGDDCELPFAIMTSDDTHTSTEKHLQDNSYYGLKEDQITLMKQGMVPTLIDNEARMTVSASNPYRLEMKPHGHGDVHTLLHQSGLIDKWASQKKKWIFFLQDTNGLSFFALPSFLGVSSENKLAMNFLAIPRYPDDSVGTICDIVKPDNTHTTMNVEYNVLDGLFKENNINKYQVDEKGYSVYPGNSNILLFDLHTYSKILKKTKGSMPEFVNPKYTDATKTKFKSATRLECMMQDFAILFSSEDKVGCTQMDRAMSFSPLKNNIKDAAIKQKSGQNPECAYTAESDQYNAAAKFLKAAAHHKNTHTHIEEGKHYEFGGVNYTMGPQIVLKPSWATSVHTMMDKIGPGNISITHNSTLIVEGDVYIDGLTLDGALHLKAAPGETLEINNLCVKNKGREIVALDNTREYPAFTHVRGYVFNEHEICVYNHN